MFNDNINIEKLAFYALDWAIYLRKDLTSPFNPFIFLKNGDKTYKRVLTPDGDPMDFILSCIKQEKEPFDYFVYGVEGRTLDDNGQKVDTIIVASFDVSQDKGTMLGQQFESKEDFGAFRPKGRTIFLDNPDLPIEKRAKNFELNEEDLNEVSINGIQVKDGELIKTVTIFTNDSISMIRNAMKNVLFDKLTNDKCHEQSGSFEFVIVPGFFQMGDFERFVMQSFIKEIPTRDTIQNWEKKYSRKVEVLIRYDKEEIAKTDSNVVNNDKVEQAKSNTETNKYTFLNEDGLKMEFFRIINIPNAQTNIEALKDMSALIKEFERRNIPLPDGNQQNNSKKIYLIWIALVILALIILIKCC